MYCSRCRRRDVQSQFHSLHPPSPTIATVQLPLSWELTFYDDDVSS